VISLLIVGVGIFSFIQKKDTAYGIDFAGGQIQEYRFDKTVNVEYLREELKTAGVEDAVIQESTSKNPQSDNTTKSIIIRTAKDTSEKVSEVLKNKFPDNKSELLRIEKVGPVVGKALRTKALLAILFSLIGMLIFIAFRFKHFNFAAAGVVALLYDVLVAVGLIVFLGRQIDLLVITALLTIAGYSINDTIVTYDRVRENWAKSRKVSLAELINASVNQTLSRTILTTTVTIFSVLALFLFGGEVLNTFSLCLLIGFASGAYSTVFIASPLVLAFNRSNPEFKS
jgi:preprotein translocase SecF subunit